MPRVEADDVMAAKLVDEELALLVADVVVAQLRAVGDLEVVRRARRDRGLVVGVADVVVLVVISWSSVYERPRLMTPVVDTALIVRFLVSTSASGSVTARWTRSRLRQTLSYETRPSAPKRHASSSDRNQRLPSATSRLPSGPKSLPSISTSRFNDSARSRLMASASLNACDVPSLFKPVRMLAALMSPVIGLQPRLERPGKSPRTVVAAETVVDGRPCTRSLDRRRRSSCPSRFRC